MSDIRKERKGVGREKETSLLGDPALKGRAVGLFCFYSLGTVSLIPGFFGQYECHPDPSCPVQEAPLRATAGFQAGREPELTI